MINRLKTFIPNDWVFSHHRLWEAFGDAKLWFITYMIAPIMMLIEKYLFNDWDFLPYLLIAMLLDLITAIIRVYIKEGSGNITSRGLRQTVIKTVQYLVFLITVHLITNIHVKGERIEVYDWMLGIAYTFLMVIEIRSIWENLTGMGNKFDLSAFIKKITNNEIWGKEQKDEQKKDNSEDGAE